MEDGIKGLADTQNDYIHCLPFTCLVGDLVVEGDHITRHFLILTMPDNSFML